MNDISMDAWHKTTTTDGVEVWCSEDGVQLDPEKLVLVTGTRKATEYGLRLAEAAGRLIGESDRTLLTTASIGCSLVAARAALEAGGHVMVVRAGGIETAPYPTEAADVHEAADCVLSADTPLMRTTRWGFKKRDDLIVHIGCPIVVCECGLPSGILALANSAMSHGRQVLAFPGRIDDPTSLGTNALIKEGATLCASVGDLSHELDLDFVVRDEREYRA